MILAACFLFDASTPFPGLAALLPCVGSALVIMAGTQGSSLVGRALSLPPVVLIGRISYSLYLWHWPIIVFKALGHYSFSASSKLDKACVILLGIALAWLSWRFVEQPFRSGGWLKSRRAAFIGGGASMVLASVLGVAMLAGGGLPWRFPPDVVATASYRVDVGSGTPCFVDLTGDWRFDSARCLAVDPSRRNVLLVGDSHAGHLAHGLATAFPEINFVVATGAGCRPLIGAAEPAGRGGCRWLRNLLFNEYLPRTRLDGVILAAAWKPREVALIEPTVAALRAHGQVPIVVGPIVMYDFNLPELLARGMLRGDPGLPARHRLEDQRVLDERLQALADRLGVRYVSLHRLLCAEGGCRERSDAGPPLQFDYGHLNVPGSVTVGRLLREHGLLD